MHPLEINSDHLHIGVIAKVFDHVGFGDIHFVPQAGKVAETNLAFDNQVHHPSGNRPALGNKSNRSGHRHSADKRRVQAGAAVHCANAVRPYGAHAVPTYNLQAFALKFRPIRTNFSKTTRDDHHGFYAALTASLQGFQDHGHGQDDHSQLYRVRHGSNIRVALLPHDLLSIRIHRVNLACVSVLEHVFQYAVRQLFGVAGCPQNGYASGIKKG